tara:strand:+ start:161 stop:472 length:312 start_codon:yes stop_codon:yes gene_type:complete
MSPTKLNKKEWGEIVESELPDFSSSELIDKYSWEVSRILIEVDDITKNDIYHKNFILTDKSKFSIFKLNESEINEISKELAVDIKESDKIIDIAKKIKKALDK